jgi:predicted O-methyltransferase YrrM
MVRIALLALAALLAAAAAFDAHVYGVDVSEPVSESAFRCLKDANLTFAVVRVRGVAREGWPP